MVTTAATITIAQDALSRRFSGEGISAGLQPAEPIRLPLVPHTCLAAQQRLGDELEWLASRGIVSGTRFYAVCDELDRLGRCDRSASSRWCRAESSRLLSELREADRAAELREFLEVCPRCGEDHANWAMWCGRGGAA